MVDGLHPEPPMLFGMLVRRSGADLTSMLVFPQSHLLRGDVEPGSQKQASLMLLRSSKRTCGIVVDAY